MLEANNNATAEWIKENGNGIPSEVCKNFPFAKQVNNELRSSVEVYEFVNNPPESYFLYINEKTKEATTWTGQKLGSVFFGSVYRSNIGDKRINITVQAINGITYHGTFYKSAGDYARIKKAKINYITGKKQN